MPPERHPPDDPRECLNRARSNLEIVAHHANDRVYLEDLCFNAQQAAEKAIKALLIERGIEFPYVHDLGLLLGLLEDDGVDVPPKADDADLLSPYAVMTRYPLTEPVTMGEYEDGVAIAEAVVRWVEEELEES